MKKTISRLLFLFALAQLQLGVIAQDTSHVRISLLTCAPGDELYSTFGHSALRIIDSTSTKVSTDGTSLQDLVFNYGTFDFNDPDFYIKFVRGKLLYCLSIDTYESFRFEYQMTNRAITEQELNLSPEEKRAIQETLRENYKPENRFYKYDFFLDNCTTRLRDLIVKIKFPHPQLPAVMPANFRFRQAIHQYLDLNKKYWSKLGIDILLGAPCDAVMTTAQQQFLPDNLMIALDSTKNVSMVRSSQNMFAVSSPKNDPGWFTPTICFWSLPALFVLLSIPANKNFRIVLRVLDGLLFFIIGLLGILLLFMWFGTDHSMTKTNYNLLWAWPTHFFAAFFLSGKKSWMKKYFLVTATGTILVLLSWFFLPQQLNTALIPLVILLGWRSWRRFRV